MIRLVKSGMGELSIYFLQFVSENERFYMLCDCEQVCVIGVYAFWELLSMPIMEHILFKRKYNYFSC